jgi:hypothetical protein
VVVYGGAIAGRVAHEVWTDRRLAGREERPPPER